MSLILVNIRDNRGFNGASMNNVCNISAIRVVYSPKAGT